MENQNANPTEAEQQLNDFVKTNRQSPPAMPGRLGESLKQIRQHVDSEAAKRAAEREQRYEQHLKLRQRAELFERFRMLVHDAGHRYRECTLENFECKLPAQKSVLASVLAYVAADCPENLVLYGTVGTGKDHLAFAVCRSAIKAGKTVRWVNGQDWFGRVRDSMDTNKSEASLVSELARPDLLCLSDPLPPRGELTPFQTSMLYRLIDARYSRGVPTICTVNVHNDKDADERMGEAIWDRLCHGAYKLRCGWGTYRKPTQDAR